MFPNREMAEKELEISGKLNRGPWIEHSIFEQQMNCSIYDILPNVKETTFIEVPIWKPPVKETNSTVEL
jgi:hypothetical protein